MNLFFFVVNGGYAPYFTSSEVLAKDIRAGMQFLSAQLNAVRIEAHAYLHGAAYGKLQTGESDRFDEIRESLVLLNRDLRDIADRNRCDIVEIGPIFNRSVDLVHTAFRASISPSAPERFLVVNDPESRLFFNSHLFLLHEIARACVPLSASAGAFLEKQGMPQGDLRAWFRQARLLITCGKVQMILRERFCWCSETTVAVLQVLQETLFIRSRLAALCGRTKVGDLAWRRVYDARPTLTRLSDEQRRGIVTQRTFSDIQSILLLYRKGFEALTGRS